MTTQEDTPTPRYGDIQPVPVHVTGVDLGVSMAPVVPSPCKKTITRFSTYVLTLANPVQPILSPDEARIRAVVIVHSSVGGSAAATSYGWLASTQAAAQAGASDQGDQTNEAAAYVSAGGTINVPFEFRGGNAVWACLDSAATTNLTLTVISDYEA